MKSSEYGYIPEKSTPDFSCIIDISSFDLPDMDTYTFDFKAKKFTVSNPKHQNFIRKLEPSRIIDSKPIHFTIDSEYLNLVTKHLKGEVYISFGANVLIIAKKTETSTQTYLIAVMLE